MTVGVTEEDEGAGPHSGHKEQHEQRPGCTSWGHDREPGHLKPRHTEKPPSRKVGFILPGFPSEAASAVSNVGEASSHPKDTQHAGGTAASRLSTSLNIRLRYSYRSRLKPLKGADQVELDQAVRQQNGLASPMELGVEPAGRAGSFCLSCL